MKRLFLILALLAPVAMPFGGPTGSLSVTGTATPCGGPMHVVIENMVFANYPYVTVVGLSAINVPFGNYVMVPAADFTYVLNTNSNGGDAYTAQFPAGLPTGQHIYIQCWQNTSVEGGANWEGTNAVDIEVNSWNPCG